MGMYFIQTFVAVCPVGECSRHSIQGVLRCRGPIVNDSWPGLSGCHFLFIIMICFTHVWPFEPCSRRGRVIAAGDNAIILTKTPSLETSIDLEKIEGKVEDDSFLLARR